MGEDAIDDEKQEKIDIPDSVPRSSSPEVFEQNLLANTKTQKSVVKEDEPVGSSTKSADKTAQAMESPTSISEVDEATTAGSEELLRVKNVLSSTKKKKIDGVLGKLHVHDQASA